MKRESHALNQLPRRNIRARRAAKIIVVVATTRVRRIKKNIIIANQRNEIIIIVNKICRRQSSILHSRSRMEFISEIKGPPMYS